MRRLHTLRVIPSLPEPIERLRTLAHDLHWTWNHEAIDLFRRLDPFHWREVGQNPIRQIAELPQETLQEAAQDKAFLALLDQVWEDFARYRSDSAWFQAEHPEDGDMRVAYLSMEFGLHECLPMYSGGLGVLAGDHLKAASDLGIPLVAIGLFYRRGYFRQYLNADGWQQENYPLYDTFTLPVEQVLGDDGDPVEFTMDLAGRPVVVQIWKVQVGRVPLYLLDTSHLDNHSDDRRITEILYGGDTEMRIRQEIILGIGGMKALVELGLHCTVFHMNEGHSAFLALERIRRRMELHQLTFDEAREATRVSHAFTTHTPVPAGIDQFSQELMDKYFRAYRELIGLDRTAFLALGGADANDPSSPFNMATMAINLSACVNGVSRKHGEVSRRMWRRLWPSLALNEIPIDSVTNGVHASSWLSPEMAHVFDRYLGPDWQQDGRDFEYWSRIEKISNEELWRAKERARQRLITFARERLASQLERRGETRATVERAADALDMEALTIGFARRFATYKRANLLLSDKQRLVRLLSDPERPVQVIIAGKAHPRDEPGKNLIREIIHFAREEGVRDRIVFLEDHDINVARHLVQGCDVWLNTPRAPMEASGTSGMKAALNGTLHCSTLDGWWAEGYHPEIGWTIGHGEVYEEPDEQDQIESELLYDLLEKEIIPLFYHRNQGRIPREWTETIKRSLVRICPQFSTGRMVRGYVEQAYLPNHRHMQRVTGDDFARAKELCAWKKRLANAWQDVKLGAVDVDTHRKLTVGDRVPVAATIQLGALQPDDIRVETFIGRVGGERDIDAGEGVPMQPGELGKDGSVRYSGEIRCDHSGVYAFSVRVLPDHPDMRSPHDLRLVAWEE